MSCCQPSATIHGATARVCRNPRFNALNPSGLFADVSIWGVANNRTRILDTNRQRLGSGRGRFGESAFARNGRVVIGSANLGNYTDPPPDVRSDRVIRNLNGRIDEFVIFDQALAAEEIQAIYDAGKPAS